MRRPPRRPARLRRPALTIRTRLTLTYAALFTVGGTFLLFALTFAFYRAIFRPMAPDQIPSRFDPDHDHFVDLSDQIRSAATEHLLRDAFLLLLLVVAASALLGWWVAGRMLRPIAAITAAARRAGQATLHERLALTGPADELKELGDTFDAMLERLDTAFAAQRRFIANASHELRTPLAVTRTATEVTLAKPHPTQAQWRAMAHDVARATDRAQHLIDSLLVLARSEQRLADVVDDDLADITAEALDRVAAEARDRGLQLETSLDPAPLEGNLGLLEIAVANLLTNAVKYTPAAGTVRVTTRTVTHPQDADHPGARAELVVANDGPPLDPATLDRFLEPFHRGDHTRLSAAQGAGLGLSIVAAVTTAHHGRLTLTARPRGGLTATVVLPRSNRPAG
ncbi:sensor histidine kinase [Kitasatospora phosalacinea]|uniref:histidine kinase n=1 Tax=Kitasatospora phosalacinea TaxID=2065 RepID=A0A9W6URE3_9ACTN|nr:HAMP domain-containing sensor histidine kinase [Kitasatospora phosalacinea]GLW57448.1 two-component sensor histidine kinase [Kitasatospora phosalacinea]